MQLDHSQIRGADLALENRPGVPREEPDAAVRGRPAQQPKTVKVFSHAGKKGELSPTFGTACPPRGLSGLLRAKAYGIPEHKAPHWLLLMLADRVDVLEHTLLPKLPFAAAATVAAGLLVRRARQAQAPLTRRLRAV